MEESREICREAIRRVKDLRHRVGSRHSCECEECGSIILVLKLARERLEQLDRIAYMERLTK